LWPKFNMGGALVNFTFISNINSLTMTSSYLMNSALGNTFLGLCAAILLSILFSSKDTKE
jgi:hypothetical protein